MKVDAEKHLNGRVQRPAALSQHRKDHCDEEYETAQEKNRGAQVSNSFRLR